MVAASLPHGETMAVEIKHRNSVQIASCNNQYEDQATQTLNFRELLYNRDNKTLGIIIPGDNGQKFRQIVSGQADNVNIEQNAQYEMKLKDDVTVNSITTKADSRGVAWKSQSLIANTTADKTIVLLFGQSGASTDGNAMIGGELIEFGVGLYSHYQVSLISSGSRFLKGATTFAKKAKLVLVKYENKFYYGIQFKSGIPANIYFTGWQKVDSLLAPPQTYDDASFTEIIELDDDSETGVVIYEYKGNDFLDTTWSFDKEILEWSEVEGAMTGYDFGNGLTLCSQGVVQNAWNQTFTSDTGYIVSLNDGEDLSISLDRPCDLIVGTTSAEATGTRTITINGLRSMRVTVPAGRPGAVIGRPQYKKNDYNKETVVISHIGGAIRYYFIEIKYKETITSGDIVSQYISTLPNTREDGAPHIIRMTGLITRDAILKIAKSLRDSSRQVELDLSKGTMEEKYVDWSSDGAEVETSGDTGGLYSAFYNCTSLRAFWYPHNVISSGGNTFQNCSFLREVHFNEEMVSLGAGSVWSPANNFLFSGARIKTIVLPPSVAQFNGYPFSSSNIKNIYIKAGSAFEVDDTGFNDWNTWGQTRKELVFHCCQALHDKWTADDYTTFYGADGDGITFISDTELRKDHIDNVVWDGDETKIDYTI